MKIFFFFWKAIKIAGRHKKTGSVRLAETQVFFVSKGPSIEVHFSATMIAASVKPCIAIVLGMPLQHALCLGLHFLLQ